MSQMVDNLVTRLAETLDGHGNVLGNLSRAEIIQHALDRREAIASKNGAIATWTPSHSTGRSPKDTFMVRRPESESKIDWDSPNCIPMTPETFDMLWADALAVLAKKDAIYYTDRTVGADPRYALEIRTVCDCALPMLFTDNMFRPVPDGIEKSVFAGGGFKLIALPHDEIDAEKYEGRLRALPGGGTSSMAITMDYDRRLGIVYGCAYQGAVKKLMFTVMNYLLPDQGILPLHCSANEGKNGDAALLLGLSGTGKTTLSADPTRALLGDDEHGWSDDGVANFENGCYAKLINLRQDKEPEIWNVTFRDAPPTEHGALVENCMMFPDGTFDVDDTRLTQNSRVSYPLSHLENIKTPPVSGHPTTILFLAADANGVLPPIAKLDPAQAMLWFLMGYTSKLAGTEQGVTEPVSTFSRFFGAPFMPRNPDDYASLLGKKMDEHGTKVFLVNTGWSGGAYGEGERMDIHLTRALVDAALTGKLDDVDYVEDPLFHLSIPKSCPGVPSDVLIPRHTWKNPADYDARAKKLAGEFSAYFDKAYGSKEIAPEVVAECPGK